MATTTDTDERYPLSGIVSAITAAMEGSDYTWTGEWTAPPECRCVREGISCLAVQASSCLTGVHECQGFVAHIPVGPGKSLIPEDLINALPSPDSQGMVDGAEVAAALQAVILDRIGWHAYWVSSLAKRLGTAFGELEESLSSSGAPGTRQDAAPVSVLTCQWCQAPIPLARGPKARFCKNSHRVSAHRAAKRERERANAAASPAR